MNSVERIRQALADGRILAAVVVALESVETVPNPCDGGSDCAFCHNQQVGPDMVHRSDCLWVQLTSRLRNLGFLADLRTWIADLDVVIAKRRGDGLGAEPKTFDLVDQRKLLQTVVKAFTVDQVVSKVQSERVENY